MTFSTASSFPDRVAQRAASIDLIRVVLSILAAPFYLLGVVVAIVWMVLGWAWAALLVGMDDTRSRARREPDL